MPNKVKVSFPKEPFDTPLTELVAGETDTIRVELSEPPLVDIAFTIHSQGFTTPDIRVTVPRGEPALIISKPVTFVKRAHKYKLRLGRALDCDLGNKFYKVDPTFELVIAVAFDPQPLSKRLDQLVVGETVKLRLEMSGQSADPVQVNVVCDGFTVSPLRVTIPAGQTSHEVDVTLKSDVGEYECKIDSVRGAKSKGFFNEDKCQHLKGKTEFGFKVGTKFAFDEESGPMNKPLDQLLPGDKVSLRFACTGTVPDNASFSVDCPGFTAGIANINPPSAPQRVHIHPNVQLTTKAGTYKATIVNPMRCEAKGELEFTIPLLAGFTAKPMGDKKEYYPGDRAVVNVQLSSSPAKKVDLLIESEGFREPVRMSFAAKTLQVRQTANVTLINKTGIYGVELSVDSGDAIADPRAHTTSVKIASRMPGLTPGFGFATREAVQPVKPKYDIGEEIGLLISAQEMPEKAGKFVIKLKCKDSKNVDKFVGPPILVPFQPSQRELRVDLSVPDDIFESAEDQDKTVTAELTDLENCTIKGKITTFVVQPPIRVEFDAEPVKPKAPQGHYPGDKVRVRVKASRAAGGNGARIAIKSDAFVHPELCADGVVFAFMAPGKAVAFVDVHLHCGAGGLADPDQPTLTAIEIVDQCVGCLPFPRKYGSIHVPLKIRPLPWVGYGSLVWLEPVKNPPYYEGEIITLFVVLSSPAPASGAKILLYSEALANDGECIVEFLPGEQRRACKVRIYNAPDPNGPDTAEFHLRALPSPVGCRLSPVPEDIVARIEVAPGPKVQFKNVWISPSAADYPRHQRVTIYAELDSPAVVDTVVRVDSAAFGGTACFIHFPAGTTVSGAKTDQKKSKDIPGVIFKTGQDVLNSEKPAVRALVTGISLAMGTPNPSLLRSAKLPGPVEGAQVSLRGDKDATFPPNAKFEEYDVVLTPVVGCVPGVNITKQVRIRLTPTPTSTTSVLPCRTPPPQKVPPLKYCNLQRLLVSEIRGKNKPAIAKRGHNGNGTFEVVASEASTKKFTDAFIQSGKIEVIAGKVLYELDEDIHNCTIAIRVDPSDDRCDLEFPHVENEDRQHPHIIVLQEFVDRLENVISSGLKPMKAYKQIKKMEKAQVESRNYPGWVVYQAKKLQKDVRQKAEAGRVLWDFKAKKRAQKFEKLLAKAVPLKELDTGFGILAIRDIMKAVQHFAAPRLERYRIIAESCGLPDPSKKGQVPAPNLQLDIDVFPSEEFCLFVNFAPIPATQFGNNGRYYADPSLSPNNSTAPDDPNRPANNTNLQESVSLPSQITPGSQSPLLNQQATETTTPNSTTVKQLPSHGGGTVLDIPTSMNSPEDIRDSVESRQKGGSLFYTEDLQFLKSGKAFEKVIPPSSKEQRVLPDKPSTRVFHPVYAEGSHSPPSELPPEEQREWAALKCGLVCNGYPRTEFMKVGQAVMAILYIVRHVGDFFSAMADMIPSWGWGVSIDLGFLEGAMRLRWGWKEYEDWRVFRWAHFQSEIQLFRLGIEIWVGFKARALFVRFEFVAFGRIQGALPLQASVERAGPDGGALFTASLGAATRAEIGIRLILIHENACYARAAVKTGFLFNFKLPDPTEDGPVAIIWEAYFLGVSIGIDFKIVGVKKVFQKEKVLVEGNPPGVPFRQGVLFPRGEEHSAWRARRQLRHVWLRVSAKINQLDEAISWWHDLQFVLINKRDPDEYEKDAENNPAYEWPWTDDPGVKVTAFGKGHAIKTTEDDLWLAQWAQFKRAVDNRQLVADGDKGGKGKVVKYSKYKRRVPLVGKKLAGEVNLVEAIAKAIERCEVTIEKVKQAVMLIDHKYISQLRAIDKEITEADEYERPVAKEFQQALDDAQSWGDAFGDVTKLVEEALADSKLARLEYYVENTDYWAIGQIAKP